jgi:hypothetical protein
MLTGQPVGYLSALAVVVVCPHCSDAQDRQSLPEPSKHFESKPWHTWSTYVGVLHAQAAVPGRETRLVGVLQHSLGI